MMTILDVLNQRVDAGDVIFWGLIVLIAWCIIWRLFLGKWLFKHDVGTFWYAMYEAGPIGTFGLVLMALVLLTLPIAAMQYLFSSSN